jgi:ribosome-associated toxin RatA of RatAB toxin-antitoxin module
MVSIKVSKEIPSSLDAVWQVVSDVDNEPKYWRGTKSIKNISRKENVVEREVVIAFKDSKCKETVILNPKRSVTVKITDGPMYGTKAIMLYPISSDSTRIDVHWDIKLKGIMGIFTNMIRKHIAEGTNQAVERISQELKE